jgi:hypothetical protein
MIRKLGKHAPKHDPRTLRLAKYLSPGLPEPPADSDWTLAAKNPWGMMLNDTLGDCTCAAIGHEVQVATANHGSETTLPDSAILTAYEAVSGYRPGQPDTDNGAAMLDVLKYWRKVGVGGHRIVGFAKVNPLVWLEVRQAIALFGGMYIGLALPTSAETQNTWSLAGAGPRPFAPDFQPGGWGGHCVFVPAYTADGFLKCITWGAPKLLTRAWLRVICDEAYVVISDDWASSTTSAPNGFDKQQLLADLTALN